MIGEGNISFESEGPHSMTSYRSDFGCYTPSTHLGVTLSFSLSTLVSLIISLCCPTLSHTTAVDH